MNENNMIKFMVYKEDSGDQLKGKACKSRIIRNF